MERNGNDMERGSTCSLLCLLGRKYQLVLTGKLVGTRAEGNRHRKRSSRIDFKKATELEEGAIIEKRRPVIHITGVVSLAGDSTAVPDEMDPSSRGGDRNKTKNTHEITTRDKKIWGRKPDWEGTITGHRLQSVAEKEVGIKRLITCKGKMTNNKV